MTRLVLAVTFAMALTACRKTRHDEPPPPVEAPAAETPEPAAKPAGCLADRLGLLSTEQDTDGEFERAREAEGDGREAEAKRLYRRGCELGLAISCTNYATRLIDSDSECAERLFGKACDAGEAFGCGMQGRMLLERAESARGRALLERTCTELGGFACSTLAGAIQSGALGPVDPARVASLRKRACDTGDAESCEDRATSDGTVAPGE